MVIDHLDEAISRVIDCIMVVHRSYEAISRVTDL